MSNDTSTYPPDTGIYKCVGVSSYIVRGLYHVAKKGGCVQQCMSSALL